jgi:2-keto-3-deoxy-L-rhamnonate aldolase RhmA
MLQEGLMLPIWTVLLSEDISRILKQCCHSRILPFIKDASQARKFVEISRELSIQGGWRETYKTQAEPWLTPREALT